MWTLHYHREINESNFSPQQHELHPMQNSVFVLYYDRTTFLASLHNKGIMNVKLISQFVGVNRRA